MVFDLSGRSGIPLKRGPKPKPSHPSNDPQYNELTLNLMQGDFTMLTLVNREKLIEAGREKRPWDSVPRIRYLGQFIVGQAPATALRGPEPRDPGPRFNSRIRS
jgi:hypothetical protein